MDKEGSILTEGEKITPAELETLALLIRGKMKSWPWSTIIDGKGDEWTEPELFEALSTPCRYKCDEKAITTYLYYMEIGREKFLIMFDPPANSYKIYKKPLQGSTLSALKPMMTVSKEFMEDCQWRT